MAKTGGPLNLEIRLRRTAQAKPTRTEVRAVLLEMIDTGRVPKGWTVALVQWRHPSKTRPGVWREGELVPDLQNLAAVLLSQLAGASIGIEQRGKA